MDILKVCTNIKCHSCWMHYCLVCFKKDFQECCHQQVGSWIFQNEGWNFPWLQKGQHFTCELGTKHRQWILPIEIFVRNLGLEVLESIKWRAEIRNVTSIAPINTNQHEPDPVYVVFAISWAFLQLKIHLGSCTDWQVACTYAHITPNFSNLKYKKKNPHN